MGCWSETCAVSKMTIYDGEQVRFLPIVQNPFLFNAQKGFPNNEAPVLPKGGSGCYITDFWVPLCLPIRGEYNDYGSIKKIPEKTGQDKAELTQFMEALKKYAIRLEVGENKYHDLAIPQDFTLDEILKALQLGRVYVHNPKCKLAVSVMMIKESVWQSLLEVDILKCEDAGIIKIFIKQDGDTYTRKGIEKEVEKSLEKYRSRIWSATSSRFASTPSKDTAKTFSEFEYVHQIISILRINYAPTCGSGSQTSNHGLWNSTMTKWKKIATKDEHRHDEE
jgi:hypothetical protein